MVKCSTTTAASQVPRLEIKPQLLKIAAEHGAGQSPWEAFALLAKGGSLSWRRGRLPWKGYANGNAGRIPTMDGAGR